MSELPQPPSGTDVLRRARLVGVARRLGDATSEVEVASVVQEAGRDVLGASWTALRTAGPAAATAPETPGTPSTPGTPGTGVTAVVALEVRGEVVGTLAATRDGARGWGPADRDLLVSLASLAAQAVDRLAALRAAASSAERTERVLGALRRSLRPTLPVRPGVEVAVRYLPADELELGGDWYDVLPTPGGSLLVAVGDVVGHDGVVAASAVQARSLLRGAAAVRPAPPSAGVRVLDAALAEPDVDVVASLVLCRLTTGEGAWRVEWCNAGHPPPLLVLPDGSASFLESEEELLLGVLPAAARTDHEVHAPIGSTLLLYSDGLVERRGSDVDARLQQLRDAGAETAGEGPAQLCDHLLKALGPPGGDDVTLVAVSLTGSGGGAPPAGAGPP